MGNTGRAPTWLGPGKQRSVHANCNARSEVGATESMSYSASAFVLLDACGSAISA